ncbi:MAG: Trm112 family protein [Desulfovibrio sp.]|jgi:uncharacterized protein YbaR (Trm112 family)|nr:Trm112 family protein [Desulfovibrio sp.]
MDSELLRILACPKCRGDLLPLRRGETLCGLSCRACRLVYPVEDDIPVLLLEEAIPQDRWECEEGSL